jgi:HPt (histidine-containing phosphotransfer) domain-containing protein
VQQRIAEIFLTSAPSRLEEMRAALAAADGHRLQQAAHSLSGMSAQMGADALAQICLQLERNATANELVRATEGVARAAIELRLVRSELQARFPQRVSVRPSTTNPRGHAA